MMRLLASGPEWIGRIGTRAIDQVVLESLRQAERSVILTVYSLNDGASEIIHAIRDCVQRGVEVRVLVDSEGPDANARKTIGRLVSELGGLGLTVATYDGEGKASLHAKAIAVDGSIGIIGSANLTRRGLNGSHELGVVFDGTEAQLLYELLMRLFHGIAREGYRNA